MPRPDRRILALVDGAANARDELEARVERVIVGAWVGFDGWYRDDLVAEVAAAAAAAVAAGQVAVAQLTDAYLAQTATIIRGRPVGPIGVPPAMAGSLRAGVTLPEVYERPAAEYRWQASQGATPIEAARSATNRARVMAATDMGLAFRDQTHTFMERTGARGYRRVVRPELSRSGTCGLCIAASNREYTRKDLLPLHSRCKCTVVEVGGRVDQGRIINDAEYEAVRDQSASTHGDDLIRVRVQVHEHGELGPVLTDARHDFRGPAQVAA